MQNRSISRRAILVAFLATAACASSALAQDTRFSTLYKFEAPAATTFTSALGSQPDTLPVVGPDGAIYGMTSVGGQYGNGVIYRFDRDTHQYTVLHTFSALNANGENADGATPGMALTRGPGDVIYGMASFGGQNGTGTVFKITTSGEFTVLHTFSALDANGTIRTEPIHCARWSSAMTATFTALPGWAGQTPASSPMVAGSRG